MRQGIRTSIGTLAAGCVVLASAGCGLGHVVGPPSRHHTESGAVLTRGVASVEPAADPRPFGAADTAFGLDVLRAWCAQYPGRNLVFSPSTLASALGMAYLGARGTTAAAMARVLHLPAASGTALAAGLQARAAALGQLSGRGVTLAASDQVWADPTLPTLRSYLNSVATGYGAGVAQAPFSADPAKAAGEINGWVKAATQGHIPKIVSADMLNQIGWVLTSALYMNAKWDTPFDVNETQPASFAVAGGAAPVKVPFMNGDDYAFASSGGWQAVSLPYSGGKVTMTALLPPAGGAAAGGAAAGGAGAGGCALPSTATLAAIARQLVHPTADQLATHVSLPKLNLSTSGETGDMKPVLRQLGMGQAFSGNADFLGLSPQACCIGFVRQAATLDVGEKGTVAAAAVAIGIVATAGHLIAHSVTFNRPFLVLVSAANTGEPLFLAEVANPALS
jgi:serpin B